MSVHESQPQSRAEALAQYREEKFVEVSGLAELVRTFLSDSSPNVAGLFQAHSALFRMQTLVKNHNFRAETRLQAVLTENELPQQFQDFILHAQDPFTQRPLLDMLREHHEAVFLR